MSSKRLYLVDGSTYIFRAYYAIRALSSTDGTPVNAVYGFTSMVLKLLRQERPDYVAVVFDTAAPTFRKQIYEAYKANRPPPPEDLVPQFPLVREVTRALGIPALEMDGWEADDIIGTLASRFGDTDVETVVVSSDKDLMQLVGGNCSMLDTMKDVRYGPDEVREKMGVRPDQIIDFLALMGDASDNIPGVPGIGKKTAATLLEQYGDLEGIYGHIHEIKGKRRENLEASRDIARLSRTLATIVTDVPLEMELEGLRRQEPDRATCTELFGRLGFKTWHREFHEASDADEGSTDAPLSRAGFRLVTSERELYQLAAVLAAAPLIAFDTETTSLDAGRAELVGIALATDVEHAWYVPVGHSAIDGAEQLDLELVREVLGPLLADPSRPLAAHNAKYDLQILARHGMSVEGLVFDSMLASYLVDPGRYRHSLDNVALDRLNHKTIKFEDVVGSGKDQVTFDRVPLSTARDYACEDAQLVMALHRVLDPEIERLQMTGLLQDLELPLARVLAEMETTGICIDSGLLEALSGELGARADVLLERCHELAGEPFNVGSPKQLAHVLFEVLGLKPIKKTKTGYSTDNSVLEQLAEVHELPRLIVEWRSLTKLKSTYTDVLPALVHPESGRIHTSFNQAVAATGRLSSTAPNLQNIPVRTEDGRRIREAFIASEGHVLLSADYSQIELRVLAHLARDDAMRRAFCDGADIHSRTASELFGVLEGLVGREQRSVAKTINFGILYGMSAFRLAREQKIPRREAQGIIDRYFERYPQIQRWKDATLEEAVRTGQVTTLLGRIRRIPDIGSHNHMTRRAAERVAVNTPIQGSAADIIKLAMVALHHRLVAERREARILLQVHDELVLEVPEAEAPVVAALVTEVMEGVIDLDVPLVVNTAWGRTWLEAH